ncbi:hypothetical protein OH492_07105 [Vibrio chagasii]|nr:hypothetical protein [Vibrio chagasii]
MLAIGVAAMHRCYRPEQSNLALALLGLCWLGFWAHTKV